MEYVQITGGRLIGRLEDFYIQSNGGHDFLTEDQSDGLICMLNEEMLDETLWAWAAFDGEVIVAACILRTVFLGISPAYPDGYMSLIIPAFPNGIDKNLLEIAIGEAKKQCIPRLYIMAGEDDSDYLLQQGFLPCNSFRFMKL